MAAWRVRCQQIDSKSKGPSWAACQRHCWEAGSRQPPIHSQHPPHSPVVDGSNIGLCQARQHGSAEDLGAQPLGLRLAEDDLGQAVQPLPAGCGQQHSRQRSRAGSAAAVKSTQLRQRQLAAAATCGSGQHGGRARREHTAPPLALFCPPTTHTCTHTQPTDLNSGRISAGGSSSRRASLSSSFRGRTRVKQSRSGNRDLMLSRICRDGKARGESKGKGGGWVGGGGGGGIVSWGWDYVWGVCTGLWAPPHSAATRSQGPATCCRRTDTDASATTPAPQAPTWFLASTARPLPASGCRAVSR